MAYSSVVEHLTDTQDVSGSSPDMPTRTECSEDGLSRAVWIREIASSNLATQTDFLLLIY